MYLPKSKYKTGLYSDGKTLVTSPDGEAYVGPYIETFDGKFFSGNSPMEKGSRELAVVEPFPEGPVDYLEPLKYDEVRQDVEAFNLRSTQPLQMSYPKVSAEDRKSASIVRYFAKDKNTGRIFEINKQDYLSLKHKETKYYYPRYDILGINWSLISRGLNISILARAEKTFPGISSYLKDPSQFVR